MFAEIDQPTPPTWAGHDGSFWVASLPGASCRLFMTVAGGPVRGRSNPFTINTGGELDGWFFALWGQGWPTDVAGETVTVYTTCTAIDGRTATSPTVDVPWPPQQPTAPPTTGP